MENAAIEAIGIVLDPARFGFLTLGVIIGLAVGIVPGLGGLVGLSILLPFTYSLDPYAALAMLLALSAVVATGDTIPAVLFGVPGTVGSAATVLDGYPMACKGEAGRAFGAAFSSSLLGGLLGAGVLLVSIPILRPLVLLIGPPELFALCLFGISLVAMLSGANRMKGLAAACLGLLLATVGDDPNTATPRWTFGTFYLFDGIPLVPLALGMFALPELAGLMMRGGSISQGPRHTAMSGQWQGVKDTLANPGLVFRSSFLGSALGAIPGLGASIIDWIAYGLAAKTIKGADKTFGKGDVRGVIASESSNNAKEGGSLIPTIAFGIPGTASMAILLGAFQIHGIVPGQAMLTDKLDVTYAMVWSIALANVVGAGICFLFANQLARLALVPVGILVPGVLAMTLLGAFQTGASVHDIYAVIGFGLLGMCFKLLGWSRPAVVLGFVLGSLIERYLVISYSLAGSAFVLRPIVAVILMITVAGVVAPLFAGIWRGRSADRARPERRSLNWSLRDVKMPDLALALMFVGVFVYALATQAGWPFKARLMPIVFASIGLLISLGVVLQMTLLRSPVAADGEPGPDRDLSSPAAKGRGIRFFLSCIVYAVMIAVTGILPSMVILMLYLLIYEGRQKWTTSVLVTSAVILASYVLFHLLVHVPWPNAWIGDLFPALRDWFPTDIV
ncbi:MAG: tripartite tricarboxylate transporter permease [Celeribacter sp.]|jgi:TctA family transporter